MNLVCAKETPIATALPPATPFKIIYSVYALKESLDYQLHEVSIPKSLDLSVPTNSNREFLPPVLFAMLSKPWTRH